MAGATFALTCQFFSKRPFFQVDGQQICQGRATLFNDSGFPRWAPHGFRTITTQASQSDAVAGQAQSVASAKHPHASVTDHATPGHPGFLEAAESRKMPHLWAGIEFPAAARRPQGTRVQEQSVIGGRCAPISSRRWRRDLAEIAEGRVTTG